MIVACLLWWPTYLVPLLGGMMLGNFNLWSLMLNAENPLGKFQYAFSLTRVVVLAYLIVLIGNFKNPDVPVVICGFLSYKVGLWMEYIRQGAQAIPGFQAKIPVNHGSLSKDRPLITPKTSATLQDIS